MVQFFGDGRLHEVVHVVVCDCVHHGHKVRAVAQSMQLDGKVVCGQRVHVLEREAPLGAVCGHKVYLAIRVGFHEARFEVGLRPAVFGAT